MDQLYALGIKLIVLIQERFSDYEQTFDTINLLTDPQLGYTFVCPLVATVDSVFGAQCFVSVATANWMNAMLKWILSEHRPYWWVKETSHYRTMNSKTPTLHLTHQTCETGPGSPSGHVMYMTCFCILFGSWLIATVFKSCGPLMRKKLSYAVFFVTAFVLSLVSASRMFIATHFPHQCLVGFLCGMAVLNIVNNLIVNPSVTPAVNENDDEMELDESEMFAISYRQFWINFYFVLFVIATSFGLFWILKYYGVDPQWTIKLAFKWCPDPKFVSVMTTPIFSLVQACGTLIGFMLCVSPKLQKHRYNTEGTRMAILFGSSIFCHLALERAEASITRDNVKFFYAAYLISYAARTIIYLRVVPIFGVMHNVWEDIIHMTDMDANVPANSRSRSL